jgi:hypothetical protein
MKTTTRSAAPIGISAILVATAFMGVAAVWAGTAGPIVGQSQGAATLAFEHTAEPLDSMLASGVSHDESQMTEGQNTSRWVSAIGGDGIDQDDSVAFG